MSEQFDGTVTINATGGATPVITLNADAGDISAGAQGRNGDLFLRDAAGKLRIQLNGATGAIVVRDANDQTVLSFDAGFALLDIGGQGSEGDLRIRDASNRNVFHFDANFALLEIGAQGNEGDLRIHDDTGAIRIHLDGSEGDIKLLGADCAEDFAVERSEELEPGTVLVIGDDQRLHESRSAYDKRVAGVLSGAGGLGPGLVLGRRAERSGRLPVALTGTVWCKAEGPVASGDLLTTSGRPGHAMRASDRRQTFGAILGKSLGPLAAETGLVPILVALQ